ncbi:MAG: hypothetical protein ACRDO8_01370, partial [Nocardioidaceae bacterium]
MGAVQSRTDLGSGKAVVGPLAGLGCLLVLLGTIDAVAGLGLPGWAVGSGCGVGASGALIRGLARREPGAHHARKGLGPADRVTLGRAVLA